MKARIPTAKAEKDAFNEYIKRNFNLYAERIFQCWAMAMNDAGATAPRKFLKQHARLTSL